MPDGLFGIQLMSSISSLKGEVEEGKAVVRIKGIPYRYYAVDTNHYQTNGKFINIIVQAREDDGEITGIIGQSEMTESECLTTIDNYRNELEIQYRIEFAARENSTFYLIEENNKMFMLGCEVKRETTLKLILASL